MTGGFTVPVYAFPFSVSMDPRGKSKNVFMQVFIRDSLNEKERVARFPKPKSPTAANASASSTTTRSTAATTRNSNDGFLQLIIEQDAKNRPSTNPLDNFLVENDPEKSQKRPLRRIAGQKSTAFPDALEPKFVKSQNATTFLPYVTFLTPPDAEAEFARYYAKKSHQENGFELGGRGRRPPNNGKSGENRDFEHRGFPSGHPFRKMIPPTGRVVGLRPATRINEEHHEVLSLEEFLKHYPKLERVRGAIPVPLKTKNHVRAVEVLANGPKRSLKDAGPESRENSQGKRQIPKDERLDEMKQLLEQLIREHSYKSVIPIPKTARRFLRNKKTSKRPKGRGTRDPKRINSGKPELEFGFRPIVEESSSAARSTSESFESTSKRFGASKATFPDFEELSGVRFRHRDPYQTSFDEEHHIHRLPRHRLPPSLLSEENGIRPSPASDPFFFTTTTAKPEKIPTREERGYDEVLGSSISSSLFDMRKFFFIPANQNSLSARNKGEGEDKDNRRNSNSGTRRFFSIL